LTPDVKQIIDQAIAVIKANVERYHFNQILYSSCKRNVDQNCTLEQDLATHIFQPAESVRAYIVGKLKNLGASR